MRALTLLNQSGDQTLVWTEDRDDDMERIIEKKMAEGCTFFLIEPRFGTRTKLKDARDASKTRMVAIPDEDFSKFVSAGSADVIKTPDAPAVVKKRAKTAKEVAAGESVGIKKRAGG